MKPLYTQEIFENSKSSDKLPCECEFCNKQYYVIKKLITQELKEKRNRIKFCSKVCLSNYNNTSQFVNCLTCNYSFKKQLNQIKKSTNHFCSKSCSTTYNNKNKTHGNRRSKLEIWLQEQLTILYPNLDIHYNQKSAIDSELDIYIPSLNVAFELNGIFHYEPIYGINKLNQIKDNDISKSKACYDCKIDLCVIDSSGQKYFKPSTSQKYLDIINTIIDRRLLTF